MTAEATCWLYERGVRVMGINAWSWDAPLHLQAERAKEAGQPAVFWAAHQADPLRIEGAGVAPARVVVGRAGGRAVSSGKPMRVEVAHRFAVGLRDGYDYITKLGNWHEYWPDLVRIDPDSRWSAPGDRTRIALRLLGRETEMTMVLDGIEPYRLVEYTSEQSGLPEARHERHFADDGEHGLAYRAVVEYVPRGGLRGLFDRVIFRRAVERAVRTTVANLDARFAARDTSS